VHLSIGQAYAFSVFHVPLTRLLGGDAPAPGDWPMTATIWTFNLAFFCLGLSAALFGPWVERSGPRKTMAAAACCFAGGFLVAALGVALHSLPLLLLGYGALGGMGLGLGYIAPVSTLHGDGAGDHGLWRRRDGGLAARDGTDGRVPRTG
jgi:MFS family permease